MMDERDCIFPDCLVREEFGCACEHSCPFQEEKFREEKKRADHATVTARQKETLQ